jgi:hypothetical protein
MLFLSSCKKETAPIPPPPDPVPGPARVPKVLLKDIVIPNLPSPFYHFEYNQDSLATKVDFASGFSIYQVLYNGNQISEMRNNVLAAVGNHDTLRYVYDNTGKLSSVHFINKDNVLYRHIFLTYDGDQVTQINWDHQSDNANFMIDRTATFSYQKDGNLHSITDQRAAQEGSPASTAVTTFDGYDDKINVDDFSLIHDTFQDHLFLFQGFRLQKNNPRTETFSGPTTSYTIDYTYTYNENGTPAIKAWNQQFTAGSMSGTTFKTTTTYSYY